jgi:hypothetical protein
MFYFGELAALILCWFFYGELHWMVERRVVKVCRKKLVEERCKTLADRLFFTPVSVRARLGTLYYINKGAFCLLAFFTAFHLALGWIDPLETFIRVVTTLLVILLGANAVANAASSTETICVDNDILSAKTVRVLQLVSFFADCFLILAYLYFAWAFVG